jgi:hypothetical protein
MIAAASHGRSCVGEPISLTTPARS